MKFPAIFNVDNLNGKNGFILTSSSLHFGYTVAGTGDINGDGKPDLMVGAHSTSKSYVIFGSDNFTATLDTSSLNGSNGFTVTAASSNIFFGTQIAGIGDVNGDGKPDIIIGAPEVNKAYIIFGASKFPAVFDASSLNGSNGFTLVSPSLAFGLSVSGIDDLNADGSSDLVVGAPDSGSAYVIFGGSSFPAMFNTSNLNGINGFKIISSSLYFAVSVSGTGDINGDGKSDLIIGAYGSNKAYIIFGTSSFPAVFDTSRLNGANGFTLTSSSANFGYSVAGIKDINGDGTADLIVGANIAGRAYVILGASNFPATLDTASLNGENGFIITSSSGNFGVSVAGGDDLNGDKKSDLIVGGEFARKAHIIFGASKFPPIFDTSSLNGENGFTLTSSSSIGVSVAGLGDVSGNGRPGMIVGAYASNKAFIIFGSTMQSNYGMLSQIQYFVSMNSNDSTGKMAIGSIGEWCNQEALFIGDFNGDGRSDLLCSLHDGQTYVMLSQLTANGVAFAPMSSDPDGKIRIGNNDKWCLKDNQELLVGDFNADGKSDLLCHNHKQFNHGATYVMLSTGTEFKPMADSPDGYVKVGKLGNFCPIGGKLVIGNFDGLPGDDLLCNDQFAGNMIMIPHNTSFVSVNDDPLGAVTLGLGRSCSKVWCSEPGSVLISGQFNNDNKADLICNSGGQNKVMISTFNNISCVFQAINPASGNQQRDGWISMGHGGKWPVWCDATKTKLIVADIDGDNLDDVVCNTAGVNEIQLCRSAANNQYEFISINAGHPEDSGRTKIANWDTWCTSQNLFTGHFSDSGLNDLWCNQDYSPVGILADEGNN